MTLADYHEATEQERTHRDQANLWAARRAEALAALHQGGQSYAQLAAATGLTRSRIQQMVERTR